MLLTRDAELAWKVGMGTTVAMGVVNGALAGAGRSVADLTGEAALAVETVRVLGNGFILTALVWGSMTALIVDHRLRSAAAVSALASVATLVGVIHSPLPTGGLFWPGSLESAWPGRLAGAYGLLATLLMGLAALRATPGAGGTGETPRP
jgi:AGZA family xanthine/uracil permease-like MFS transporter